MIIVSQDGRDDVVYGVGIEKRIECGADFYYSVRVKGISFGWYRTLDKAKEVIAEIRTQYINYKIAKITIQTEYMEKYGIYQMPREWTWER